MVSAHFPIPRLEADVSDRFRRPTTKYIFRGLDTIFASGSTICSSRPFTHTLCLVLFPWPVCRPSPRSCRPFDFIWPRFVLPVGYMWRVLDWMLRWYQVTRREPTHPDDPINISCQPYVTMSKGNATAEESVLLDYVRLRDF